ncbi:hypothetical protein CANCADRAFT_19560, partial [Tortispora caseinolytica NRRL Y-17796]
PGTRLFVGNLAGTRVTKSDLWRVFAKHGKIAQITYKANYGFVQFVKPNDCLRAQRAENGAYLLNREMKLEIS